MKPRNLLRNFISFYHQCLPGGGTGFSPKFPGSVPFLMKAGCGIIGVASQKGDSGDQAQASRPLRKGKNRGGRDDAWIYGEAHPAFLHREWHRPTKL